MKNLGIFGAIALLTCCMQNANAAPVTAYDQQLLNLSLIPASVNTDVKPKQQVKLTTSLKWYMPYFDVGGYYSKLEPNEAGQANFFLPLLQNPNNLLFSSIRAYDKSGNPWEGNLSVGYRNLSENQNNLWGIYGSYDRLRSQAENYFNQATVGGEFWHQTWFAGANVYIPFGDTLKDDLDAQATDLRQNGAYQNIWYGAGYERAMTGFDAEIGNNIWRGLTVYAGGYYYDAHNVKAVTGPRARATYTWYSDKHRILGLFDRVRVETEAQYDDPRGFNWYAGLRFTVNLFHKPDDLQGVAKHMVDPINRDLDVVTQSYHNPLQLLKKKDGTAVNVKDVDSEPEFNDALADGNVDIIAIDGNIDFDDTKDLGDRDLYITGGQYSFNRDGQDFNVRVGHDGEVTAAGDYALFNINDTSNSNFVIRDLKLNASQDGNIVITNQSDQSFGTLTVDNISTHGRLVIGLNGDGLTGNVSVMNSRFDTRDWVGTTNPIDNPEDAGAVVFAAENGANLSVGNFTHNTISTEGNRAYGVYNLANIDSTLTFNGNFSNNNISTQGDSAYGVYNLANTNSTLTFNGDFSNNNVSTEGYGAYVVFNLASNISTLTFNGDFSSNHISIQGNNAVGVYNFVYYYSTLTFNGAFSNNNIHNQGNVGIFGDGVYNSANNNSSLIFNGPFSSNYISTQGDNANGMYNIAENYGTITFNGLFDNHVTSAKADDFYFATQAEGRIDVYVNDPSGRGLSAANHGASVGQSGSDINIYP